MKNEQRLIQVSSQWKQALFDYKEEFLRLSETIPGSASLDRFQTIEDWLNSLQKNGGNLSNHQPVSSGQFLFVQVPDKKILGMLHLRKNLNDRLLKRGGNIGYSIAPSERRKGYASLMLKEGLKKADEANLEKVLLTCDDDNIASYKVIEANQGVLENKHFDEASQKWIRRYWISLNHEK